MNSPPHNDNSSSPLMGSRWQGVLIFLIGLAFGYLSIVMPLQQARAGAPQISWAGQFAFLAPPLILLGVLATIFPSMTTNDTFLLKSRDKLSVAGWIILAILVLIGAATAYLVNQQLASLGYK